MRGKRWLVLAAAAVVVRPSLWATALGQVGRLARPRWWRRAPFLPTPDPAYLRFRLLTAYGAERDPEPQDVIAYLHWCKDFPGPKGRTERRGTHR